MPEILQGMAYTVDSGVCVWSYMMLISNMVLCTRSQDSSVSARRVRVVSYTAESGMLYSQLLDLRAENGLVIRRVKPQ